MNWKKSICIINIISLLLVGFVGFRFLLILPPKWGGWQHSKSSNGLYEATVRLYHKKCFWGKKREYYRFDIQNTATGNVVHNFRMIPNKPSFDMREEDNIITWSSDSSEVTFAFQEIELKLKTDKDSSSKDEQKQ